MAIKSVNLPPTEFGAKLKSNSDEDFRVVYRPSERNPDFYIYHDLWYPEEDYPDGYVAVPFGSVYGGKTMYPQGTVFANVEGSSRDTKPKDPDGNTCTSWRQLMKAYNLANYTTCCAELNRIYDSATGAPLLNFSCTNEGEEKYDPDFNKCIWIKGAHVLMDETASRKPPEGSTVYLLPLCGEHNIHKINPNSRYGTGYYMRLGRAQEVIILTGFIPSDTIQKAILKGEPEVKNLQTTEKPQLSIG
ncbi:MAG: hypothetical protein K2O14_14415, partial [Oscillospiraceae bacterium]|nr:hypothetical protein [Oscillospiraceae bacterium]